MTIELLYMLSGMVTVALALIFFYFPWQSFVADQTRQRLFEIRDKWFDYSTSLDSSSDREAAAAIRAELNYMIRLVHHFTFPVALCASVIRLFWKDAKEGEAVLLREIGRLQSDEARSEAKKAVFSAIGHLTWGMARRSVVVLCLTPVLIVPVILLSATIGGAASASSELKKLVATLAVKDNSKLVPHW